MASANTCTTELMWSAFDWIQSFGCVQGDISVWKLDKGLFMENRELRGNWTGTDWILQWQDSVSAENYSVAIHTGYNCWWEWQENVNKWLKISDKMTYFPQMDNRSADFLYTWWYNHWHMQEPDQGWCSYLTSGVPYWYTKDLDISYKILNPICGEKWECHKQKSC